MKLIITMFLSFCLNISVFATDLTNQQKINLLNKVGYGVTDEDLEHLKNITYEDWLNEQLNLLDNENDKKIEENFKFPQGKEDFFNFYKSHDFYYNFLFLKKENDDIHESIINKELKKRMSYALSSKYRIREMMVWFWYNHFNTGVYLNTTPAIFLDNYETNLRNLSFGSFKDLLTMVSSNPSMLVYLNNTENQKENESTTTGLNENYAREFLELHTMGVDSGYSQQDVQELAKILSGQSILSFVDNSNQPDKIKNYEELKKHNEEQCDYSVVKDYNIFCSNKHFTENKIFLGNVIKDNNEKEINEVIDIIVKRKETAQFISKKIAIYFISDNPSQEIINKMSEAFLNNNSSIKETLKVMFLSEEFIDSLNKPIKIKDTYTYILSTLKTGLNKNFWNDNELMSNLSYFLKDIEASPYVKNTPEGFSIYGVDYMSSGRLQEYLFFTDMTFQKYSLIKKYGINYELINKISNQKIKTEKEVTYFFNSEYWLKR